MSVDGDGRGAKDQTCTWMYCMHDRGSDKAETLIGQQLHARRTVQPCFNLESRNNDKLLVEYYNTGQTGCCTFSAY